MFKDNKLYQIIFVFLYKNLIIKLLYKNFINIFIQECKVKNRNDINRGLNQCNNTKNFI